MAQTKLMEPFETLHGKISKNENWYCRRMKNGKTYIVRMKKTDNKPPTEAQLLVRRQYGQIYRRISEELANNRAYWQQRYEADPGANRHQRLCDYIKHVLFQTCKQP